MPLETATYISELNASNPAHSDAISQADSHLRLIKSTLDATFPNFTAAALSATQAELDAAADGIMGAGTVTAPGISVSGDANTGIYAPAADTLAITAGGVQVAAFSSAGVAVPLGVAFPATQVDSADANTLDDYEEGTWTPGLEFGGGSTGLTYTSRSGVYTKIGRVVFFHGTLTVNSNGSSTGDALVTGLPFAVGGSGMRPIFSLICNGADIDQTDDNSFYMFATGLSGEDGATLLFNDGGDDNPLGEWFFQDGSSLHISGQYFV